MALAAAARFVNINKKYMILSLGVCHYFVYVTWRVVSTHVRIYIQNMLL